MSLKFHFGELAAAPFRYHLARTLSHILDGITGLIMLPFGRYGTDFYYTMTVKIMRSALAESKNRKANSIR